jgi:hypothetical protein
MRSSYHNLPEIDGHLPAPGARYRARDGYATLADRYAQLDLDPAPTYPEAAGVRRWRRSLRLDRDAGYMSIVDEWELAARPTALAQPAHRQPGDSGPFRGISRRTAGTGWCWPPAPTDRQRIVSAPRHPVGPCRRWPRRP